MGIGMGYEQFVVSLSRVVSESGGRRVSCISGTLRKQSNEHFNFVSC
jgi:hypothetical protein